MSSSSDAAGTTIPVRVLRALRCMLSAPALLAVMLVLTLSGLSYWMLRDRALYNVSVPAEGRYWSVAQYQIALAMLRQYAYERELAASDVERATADALVRRWTGVVKTKLVVLTHAEEHKHFFEKLEGYRTALPLLEGLDADLDRLVDDARGTRAGLERMKARFDAVDDALASFASDTRLRDLDDLTDSLNQYRAGLRMKYFAVLVCVLLFGVAAMYMRAAAAKAQQGEADSRRALQAAMQAGEEIQQTLQARTALIGILPHELRSPLQALTAIVEQIEISDEAGVYEYEVEQLHQGIARIDRHVSDLRRYAELGRGEFGPPVPLDLRVLLVEVAREYRAAAQEKGVALEVVVSPQVPGTLPIDAIRVGQIASNLIGNAVKYTIAGTVKVSAALRRDEQGGQRLLLAVADTGPGIPPQEQGDIWMPFYRGDDSKAQPGTGLGLAIVRLAAESLGGAVHFQSEVGEGSTFTLEVPYSIEAIAATQA